MNVIVVNPVCQTLPLSSVLQPVTSVHRCDTAFHPTWSLLTNILLCGVDTVRYHGAVMLHVPLQHVCVLSGG